ncbi:hypothetical protein COCC4DRAFT_71595 [Bipolaris maydis ATCC 48331]|uniref:Uncharacterized protein n=3 Tax=Cochliobolus heterostrophus TaxID=5016 RepID=M2UBB8_COCH5|nr:uncharacterized protein COCC4DRAFT_71595 [Bipolaris maydis ATCC 48331]EMD91001.1 hypothetical protein COCHEDRAFT_1194718 [Bipolaris maydis C5]KAJ5064598.1 hypothetical protein J3E74DRAFT_263335 [Bipolaris maydis]ENI05915.1 hypothetical protein COCC4DRAFT_71595 [Bipolaris maydis ATCC 48331]KAJ6193390.1 hypothetical protein J3E72DRAFT_251688 [Bipolaris maydis]KAJ6205205.1 hypothetical protein PSV09DRAFT_1194718 [Bipolaris maydis]
MANIPLHCNICPKKPNFSDVSHLLTHIASKGHLSNYYKVKVRSTNEESSRQLIEAYDQWYAEWSVEELMSERMNQKDKRRTRAKPAARSTSAPKVEVPVPRPVRRAAAAGSFLDPRLAEQQRQHTAIKVEQSPSPISQTAGPVLRNRNTFAPHMQYWPTESRASSQSYTNPDYETSSEYSDPSERRRSYQHAAASCAIDDDPADVADPMAVSESTKLKGVYWPGMDIFDSATPEMRRKRNQKKDSSVVAQLELNSLDVEATELIFTPLGTFKRQRRISCSESDGDEMDLKSESSPPMRRRPALAQLDVNTSRRSRQSNHPAFPFLDRNQYDEDYGRTSNRARTSKRKRFDVFQDDSAVSFSQPSSMTYLTSAFTRQPSPSPTAPFHTYKPFNDSFQYDSKENIMSSFHQAAYSNVHSHQSTSYQYPTYAYGLGPDHQVFQYSTHLYNAANEYPQHDQDDDDDQRTITAPPSPSMS